jgi:hypothetical protein
MRLDFREASFGLFRNTTAEHDFGASAGEPDSHGATKFARTANDDSDFTREIEERFEKSSRGHDARSSEDNVASGDNFAKNKS